MKFCVYLFRTGLLLSGLFAEAITFAQTPQAPVITSASFTKFVARSPGTFTVTATGSPAPTFSITSSTFPSWATFNPVTGVISGTPPDTTESSFTLSIQATNSAGTAGQSFTLFVSPPSGIASLSVRQAVPVEGISSTFTITGAGTQTVLIRGLGPALAGFGVSGTLADPQLTLTNSSTGAVVASNNDWGTAANAAQIPAVTNQVGAFPLSNGSRDAVILQALSAGTYTAKLTGVGSTAGIALLEVYRTDTGTDARVSYLSFRGSVGTGSNILFPGFVLSGASSQNVLIRAMGPSLNTTGALADPSLGLYTGSTLVAQNDDWGGASSISSAVTQVSALPFNSSTSKDSAFLGALAPGTSYTAQVSGVGGTTGIGLFEVFDLDAVPASPPPATPSPVIVTPPLSRFVITGQTTSFSVVASGAAPLSYQWKRRGQAIAGATGATLSLSPASLTDRGWYQVEVTNAAGTATSVCMLDVALPAETVAGWGLNVGGETTTPAGLTDVVAVAGGYRRSIALRANGTVMGWGQTDWGTVVAPAGLTGVVSISAQNQHTLAVKSDGTLVGWGENNLNQLNIPAGLGGVVGASAGWGHSLALKSDGTVVAWGLNSSGQCVVPAGLSNVVKVAAGENHSLALRADGTVVAWGNGSIASPPAGLTNVTDIASGGRHVLALKADGTVVGWGDWVYGQTAVPATLTGVVGIAAGISHSLALKSDGSIVGWGSTNDGATTVPAGLPNAVAIAAGTYHSLALVPWGVVSITAQPVATTVQAGGTLTLSVTVTGTLPTFQWFRNGIKLGDNATTSGSQTATLRVTNVQSLDAGDYTVVVTGAAGNVSSNAAAVAIVASPNGSPVLTSWPLSKRVAVGQQASFSVTSNETGAVSYLWKRNGQTLPGATNATLNIAGAQVSDRGLYEVVVTNSAGKSTTSYVALDVSIPDGAPLAWTSNTALSTLVPSGVRGIAAISAGSYFAMGLKVDGTVVAWGENDFGVTEIPANLSGVVAIAAGGSHALALLNNGTVVAWGGNWQGQRNVPAGLANVVRIFAGRQSSAALRADGVLVSWGDGFYTSQRPANLGIPIDLVLEDNYSIALRTDGTLIGWGRADSGELSIPSGLGPVSAIGGRIAKSFALRADGTIAAWGSQAASIPTNLAGIRAIAAGFGYDVFLKNDGTVLQIGNMPPPSGLVDVAAISALVAGPIALVPATPPRIDVHPATQQVATGGTATFTVTASGTIPLAYQWRFKGFAIPGATASTFSVSSVQLPQTGEYSVVVTNAFGTATSNAAILTGFNAPPTITTNPQAVSVVAGQGATLTVVASSSGNLAYQWRKDGTALPGATAATLNLGATSLAMNGSYDVVVSDGLSFTISQRVNVQVVPTAYPQVINTDTGIRAAFEGYGGSVQGFLRLGDGKVMVVGTFSRVHGLSASNIGRLMADGSADATFAAPAIDGPVYAAAVQADGKVIIGGAFKIVGGKKRGALARLNIDGSLDNSFAPTTDFGDVRTLAVQPSGKIVVGGNFASLARVNGDGSNDVTFAPAPNGAVYALLVLTDGRIVVGGAFTQIAGQPSAGIAQLTLDGAYDGTFSPGSGFNGPVYALRSSSGSVLVGGAFTNYNGSSVNRIARLLATGGIDSSFATGTGFNATVFALDVRSDGKIFAAGAFGSYNGVARAAVARLQATGALDSAFRTFDFVTRAPTAVTYLDNDLVLAGGDLQVGDPNAVPIRGIAILNSSGTLIGPYGTGLLISSSVNKLVRLPDGRLIAGGPFAYVNGVAAPYLARLNADGSLDASFSSNATGGPTAPVDDMVLQADGKLVIVGDVRGYRSTFIDRVVRINSDGSIDAGFRPGDKFFATPDRILTMPEGRLLVAAKSYSPTGAPRRDTLVAIRADGSVDSTFATPPLPKGEIHALLVQPDGKIVVGGAFRSFNGAACDFVVRLLADGVRDLSFTVRTDDTVRALALQDDGKILLGGDFLMVNDVARARLARVQSNGNLDPAFAPSLSLNGSPTLLRLEPGGRIWASGNFNSVNDHPVQRYLVRITSAGALDSSFAAPGLNAAVRDLALTEDGSLWLAGGELTLGGVAREGLAKAMTIAGPIVIGQPISQTMPAGASVTLSFAVAGGQNVSYQWLKNGVVVAGATNPTLSLPAAQTADSGNYVARVTHTGGTLDSTGAALTVSASPPSLASNDVAGFGGAIKSGSRWALTAPAVIAGSTPLSYEWSRNGAIIAGATGRTLLIPSWQPSDAGIYQVTIGNAVGSISSAPFVQQVATQPDWDWKLPLPQGNNLFAMAYLNGRFVGGGSRGTIMASSDGTTWSVARLGVSNTVADFAFGSGTYVALASFGSVWTSPDALAWTQRDTGVGGDGRYFSAIAFGAGRFVAVGGGGLIATSSDGVIWRTTTAGIAEPLGAVAFGGGKFIALGSGGRTYISGDGLSWSGATTLPRPVTSIAYGAGRFVAASANQVFSSSDGLSWSQRTLDTTAGVTALQFSDVGFLATIDGTSGTFWRSPDGVDWTEESTGLTLNVAASAIAHGGGRYVVAGPASETLVASSAAGTWTRVTAPETLNFAAAAANANHLIAFSNTGALRISTGGVVTFLPVSLNDYDRPSDIAFGGGTFVATMLSGSILTSTDGSVWNRWTDSSKSHAGVSFVNNRFFVLGTNGSMLTSPDASLSSWTSVNSGTSQTLFKTAYGAGTYVTAGANGTLMGSTNGTSWTPRDPNGIFSNINDLIFAANTFVLVTEGGSIRTSGDGATWTPRANPLGAPLKTVIYADGRFFAFTTGNTNYLTSGDAITWTVAQHGDANTTADVVEFNGRLYRLAAGGAVGSLPLGIAAPTILIPPQAQTVGPGGSATLSITAGGTGPFFYQWFRNGIALIGANSSTLVLNNVSDSDAGGYKVSITNSAGSTESAAVVLSIVATPPRIIAQPISRTVNTGSPATFSVVADGSAPLSYQWMKGGMAIANATATSLTLSNVQPADAGAYTVKVTNAVGEAISTSATLTVLPAGVTAVHQLARQDYEPGPVAVVNTFTYPGSAPSLRWHVLLPAGFSLASSTGDEGSVKPAAGSTGLAEWSWAIAPTSPITFTYILNPPATLPSSADVVTLVTFQSSGDPMQFLAQPDPLNISRRHSADTDGDGRVSLFELTRVIELYNTRNGTARTGCYKIQDGTEDGFAADAPRAVGSATLSRYHAADTRGATTGSPRDGALDLFELTRVIELYNYRTGTSRTGQYHVQAGTEDGFAPGP